MFIMVAASFFFVCGVSADSKVQFTLDPGETMVVYLDNEYSFDVPGNSKGDYGFFNWEVSETPIGHTGLIKSSVVNYAGASMPNITVSAQRDSTYSGNFTFMFNSNVGSGSTVRLYLSVAVTLQNLTDNTISGYMGLNLSGWNYSASNIPNTGTLDEMLNQILDALGESSGASAFLGDDALFYLNSSYFPVVELNGGSGSYDSNYGYFNVTSAASNVPFNVHFNSVSPGRPISLAFSPGTYVFYWSAPAIPNVIFPNTSSYLEILETGNIENSGIYYGYVVFSIDHFVSGPRVTLSFNDTFTGYIYGGCIPASDDYLAGAAVNPDQSGLVEDVDNAGQQQQQQEDQLWTNINSYKGDLTFNLDDWSEAAGGLSYVSGIFMSIWNNSPTQIIVLSLMLGIAMLSIGRGAMAAVRVSRNRLHDD